MVGTFEKPVTDSTAKFMTRLFGKQQEILTMIIPKKYLENK